MTAFKMGRHTLGGMLLGFLLLVSGCGGSDGGLFEGLGTPSFWATDLATGAYYQVSAPEAGSGLHCRVYVETGHVLSQSTIDNIVGQFDNVIYPGVTGAFGKPPEPGVDNDARITLLFLNIRSRVSADGGIIGGYFTAINEFLQSDLTKAHFSDKSNEREMIYLNVASRAPGSVASSRIIAHELQHMVHWEQKTHRLSSVSTLLAGGGVTDNTWLNEGMSESAQLFCGYGPDNDRIAYFAQNPATSLTIWNGSLANYAAVYMWSQFIFDRYPRTLFRAVLLDNNIGVASVDNTMSQLPTPTTFSQAFFDWTVANIVAADNALRATVGLNPAQTYVTPFSLSAMFTSNANRVNPLAIPSLRQWTGDYYQFRRATAPFAGTVTWSAGSGQSSATFFSLGDNTATWSVQSGTTLPYANTGYLVDRNATGTDNVALVPGTITVTPSVILGALMQMPSGSARPAGLTPSGEPQMKCGFDHFEPREAQIRARGLRVRF